MTQPSRSQRAGRRSDTHYVERSTTEAGEVLELTEPVRATIRPEDLVP